MNATSIFAVLCFTIAQAARAATPCDEAQSECREDCSIEFGGSTQLVMKKKFDGCLAKCTKTAGLCTERAMETQRSGLDEGALKDSPGSAEVDSEGFSTAPRRSKTKPLPPVKNDDAWSRDTAAEPEPKVKKQTKAESNRPGPALQESEVPKSSRSEIKVDPKEESRMKEDARLEEEARAEQARQGEAAKKRRDDPPAEQPVPRVAESRKAANDELREDLKPAVKAEPARGAEVPTVERKSASKKPERKKDTEDDLRNF